MATTFHVSNKEPSKHYSFANRRDAPSLTDQIKHSTKYRNNKCAEILQTSKFPEDAYSTDNGFVNTVVDAYNYHHNLILRPDDIWAAIMTQFSYYINNHAEEFRGKFVDLEGKRELEVKVSGDMSSAPYDNLTKLLCEEIHRNLVNREVKECILPNFSTTSENDLVSIGAVFMANMKKYFDYRCTLLCGIPKITLEGTLEDWINIHVRLEKLKEYNLGKWYEMLEPILHQFVNAKRGKVDLEFWKRIAHHEAEGSGSNYISGWITAFCVFNKDGHWQESNREFEGEPVTLDGMMQRWLRLDTKDIPTGIVEVNVKIYDYGSMYNCIMFAGHLAAEIKEKGYTVQPTLGWMMALIGEDRDSNRNNRTDRHPVEYEWSDENLRVAWNLDL